MRGHMERAVDVVFDGHEIVQLGGDKVKMENTHGTGCTFASALTAQLAAGRGLIEGATLAKANAAGGGRAIPLKTPKQSTLTRTHWSPRGDWLLWVGSDGLYVVAADGTKFERVSAERDWQSYGFSKGGDAVLGVRLGSSHHWLVCSLDVASKKERVISDLGVLGDIGFFHAFSLAPDGKSFITSVSHQTGDVWILRGFPRPARLFGKWWR